MGSVRARVGLDGSTDTLQESQGCSDVQQVRGQRRAMGDVRLRMGVGRLL